ncbi:MAG TPA: uracil-DNA glycosylase [Vicinamibacteria bacterium]|nr:uracil-DNA glycosylase [Vicinamibacteria bacterium]
MSGREEVLADLLAHGRFLESLSPVGVPRPSSVAEAGESAPQSSAPSLADLGTRPAEDPAAALAAVRETIGDCRRCKLWSGRKTIVYGQGDPHAELMFVGEAPGADEDEQGLAFVGRAGQLLTDIIEKGLRMKRSEVWIGNILKCRPPQNRNPEPDEVLSCQPFLERQIDAIRPKVIVGLGKFGGQWLLKTAEPISRIRGRVGQYRGVNVVPTWHPAYLLRNPAAKKDVWEDMKTVLRLLGRPLPGGRG